MRCQYPMILTRVTNCHKEVTQWIRKRYYIFSNYDKTINYIYLFFYLRNLIV